MVSQVGNGSGKIGNCLIDCFGKKVLAAPFFRVDENRLLSS